MGVVRARQEPHRTYLTVDLESGTHDAAMRKIEKLNQRRQNGAEPLSLTGLARTLLGSWLNSHGEPTPRIRMTVDVNWGTYVRLRERIEATNRALPRNGRRLTEQRIVRYLVGSWSTNDAGVPDSLTSFQPRFGGQ